tara:strand:- start:179 stop:478 length:300 start_codon:yes stop_codon:yes gene_type:complete
MNDLREKIQDQLDRIIGMDPVLNVADWDERYDDVVASLEALVIEYSVDVTSDTLSDMPACSEEDVVGYEIQDVEEPAKPKVTKHISMDFSEQKESHIAP